MHRTFRKHDHYWHRFIAVINYSNAIKVLSLLIVQHIFDQFRKHLKVGIFLCFFSSILLVYTPEDNTSTIVIQPEKTDENI